ncbi:hypothetical protein E2C01_020536 [Portunus trituberculatus]|uniref:Uncharacterized protein n=1 Tax=Portunus trituberculatus TaxID=210409 RepID=A0A5B7E1Z7_PORTR|nr:hypothetical protein [Portunus trituberculatus]
MMRDCPSPLTYWRHQTRPIAPVSTLEECMGSAVQLQPLSGAGNFIYSGTHIRAHITTQALQLLPLSGTGNFIYSGTHIRAHITTQAHLGCNHLEPGYHGDM